MEELERRQAAAAPRGGVGSVGRSHGSSQARQRSTNGRLEGFNVLKSDERPTALDALQQNALNLKHEKRIRVFI
ncbi:unnamed protein product [Pleuronectes platessa]|uniref:Uncharacterized protein n=1 Tax=Pleuronectes platessa TaxID=8262 RepID=A0A9N7UC26_PLEPL|nr:unnamed protein product [Pleuronectes platessa]